MQHDQAKRKNSTSKEENKEIDERNKLLYSQPVFSRYDVGTGDSYEFGLQHEQENVKLEIKAPFSVDFIAKIILEDRCYNTKKKYYALNDTPYLFQHKPRSWLISLGYIIPEGKN